MHKAGTELLINRKRLATAALQQQLMLAWYTAGVEMGETARDRSPVGVLEGWLSDMKASSAILPAKKGTCKVS